MAHIVQLRTMTPTIYTVSVEAESYEEAVKKVKKDLQEKGWDSGYWSHSEVQEVMYSEATDLEVWE